MNIFSKLVLSIAVLIVMGGGVMTIYKHTACAEHGGDASGCGNGNSEHGPDGDGPCVGSWCLPVDPPPPRGACKLVVTPSSVTEGEDSVKISWRLRLRSWCRPRLKVPASFSCRAVNRKVRFTRCHNRRSCLSNF